MTTHDDTAIAEKINKLLSLAQSDNEHEANAALQRAAELMAKHGISKEQLSQADIENDANVDFENLIFPSGKMLWARDLAYWVSRAFGCQSIVMTTPGSFEGKHIKIYGSRADRMAAKLMVDYAFSCLDRIVKREKKKYKAEWATHASRTFSHNVRVGASRSMCVTCKELARSRKESDVSHQYGLVVVNKTAQLFKEHHPTTGKTSRLGARGDSHGYSQGHAAGQRVSFQRQATGGTHRQLK